MMTPAARSVRAGMGLLAWRLSACFRDRSHAPAPASVEFGPSAAAHSLATPGLTDTIARGALHRSFLVRQGPWAIHVLDVDRAACWKAVAVKGHPGAAGRTKTSALAASMVATNTVVAGGVNADFFLFDPPGVPTGAHVSNGTVVTGPGARPVFAIDSDGSPVDRRP